MSYEIKYIANFERELKRLAKKYRSIKDDLETLAELLQKNPEQGDDLGNDVYKIRMAIKSKGKGKSGGARVITHVKIIDETVYLLSIYNKGEQNNISKNKIIELLQDVEVMIDEEQTDEEE